MTELKKKNPFSKLASKSGRKPPEFKTPKQGAPHVTGFFFLERKRKSESSGGHWLSDIMTTRMLGEGGLQLVFIKEDGE